MVSRRAILRPAAAAAAAAILAGGCAAVPTVGRPEPVSGAGGQAQQFVQPIPPVPTADWTPREIVLGFLAASASFTDNHAAARRFLAPQLRKNFRPSWAVTVVSSIIPSNQGRAGPPHVQGAPNDVDTVVLSGQQLASISNIGQYLDDPGSHPYKFQLAKINNQWFITDLPRTSLLLTQADFEEVYQPRNLYFWSPGFEALVPEPVFAPQQDNYADVATNLVNALLTTNQETETGTWLADATTTAFPAGTTLLGQVTVTGSSAVVNLGGAAGSAGPTALQRMAAQLVTTLTSTSYLQPSISRSVILEIDGQARSIDDNKIQQPGNYANLVPGPQTAAAPLYFVNAAGTVATLSHGSTVRQVSGPVGHAQFPFRTIAVSPFPAQFAGTLATGKDCTIYYGPLTGSAPLGHRELPGRPGASCTSLSWDVLGDLWAVTTRQTWVLPSGGKPPLAISLPPLPGRAPPSYRVLSLRVAPDGVRAAMLVQTQSGAREVVLTAITRGGGQITLGPTVTIGTSLRGLVTALSWYDADHVIELAGSQLYEVPANGGAAVPIGPVRPGTESITSAGPGKIATAGEGEILTSSGPDQVQQPAVKGSSPVYPG